MNIVIIGQGAIGLLWYYKLSQQPENNVTLQSSSRSKDCKNSSQNMLFTDLTQQKHQQIIMYASNNDLQQADLVIYCLKAYNIENAHSHYRTILNKKALIIYAHNGLLAVKKPLSAKHSLNTQPELTMLMTHGSLKTNDYEITHTGHGQSDIGLIRGQVSQECLNNLVFLLNKALPTVNWQNNIKEKQWLKLAINCVINPLTALHNCNNGLITSETFRQDINDILQEVITIAAKNELVFSIENLTKDVLTVAENTAKNCSSMRSDLFAKRKTEIDQINGFIHQQGIKHNIATPKNTALWQAIKKLETKFSS
jgi:2-dehydropantoate 2-reductase